MAYIDKINKNSTDYDLQDSKAARSVDGTTASHVELTNQIFTESTQATTASFIYRTTAGDVSIETGGATIQYIDGNTVQTGHTDEVIDLSYEFTGAGSSASVTDKDTWRSWAATHGAEGGTTTFVWGTPTASRWNWTAPLASGTMTAAELPTNCGITAVVPNGLTQGDTITVSYTKLVVGTLTTAAPTSFVATGFNQYDATAGYAHVVGGNQYRIAGTYTSLGFTTTVGGTTTAVTVTDSKFTPAEDGYIYVTGASGEILIALVWSGTMDSEPYSAYSTTSVTIPTVDASNNALPTASYGMPSVHGVSDRLSFADKTYIQRIGHYAYSAENLATVEAMGVDCWYDTNDIFYVLASPVTYTLADSVSGAYTANDYGTEEIVGTTVPMSVNIVYGNSLVDKLRNLLTIQTIGNGLTLTGTELSASGGGGGVTELTSANYNYPADNPTSIALWLLGTGLYKIGGSSNVNVRFSSSSQSAVSPGTSFFILSEAGASNRACIMRITDTLPPHIWLTNTNGTATLTNTPLASLADIYADPDTQRRVRIGASATTNNYSVGIGKSASASGTYATAIGTSATVNQNGSVALGAYSATSSVGEMNIGSTNTTYGYNSSNYRLLTGLYDPQSAHDAATKGYVDTAHSYSTSEVDTGTTWIDGSTIYKKTINFGALPDASSKTVAHAISNLNYIVKWDGMTTRTGDSIFRPLPLVNPADATLQASVEFDATNVYVYTGSDRSDYSAYITLYYTKSS